VPGFLPNLSTGEVDRFVALGEEGRRKTRAGDPGGAEAAYRAQIAIFPGNYEPYVSLAFVAAGRGAPKEALENLRAAMVRGFYDLGRIQRAEGWGKMRSTMNFYALETYLPDLVEEESKHAGWGSFKVKETPPDLRSVLSDREALDAKVDRMAPALGPRLTRLWKRTIERATAARLEAYVAARPDAPDLEPAIASLLTLYTGGVESRWEVLPAEVASRIDKAAGTLLERSPETPLRPAARYCRALARNASRDAQGRLAAADGEQILGWLDQSISEAPASPFVASVAAGLIRTEVDLQHVDRARGRYADLHARLATDGATWGRVRGQIGDLVLTVGGVPDFRATGLDGTEIAPAGLRGRVAVVDFWATWCRPCIEELPTLRRLHERHGDRLAMVGINMDSSDEMPIDQLRGWIAREKVPGTQLSDGRGWESELVSAFGVTEIPFTVVIDADGKVAAVNARGKRLEQAVEAALRKMQVDRAAAR